ncbi:MULTISPECIES: DMT family transporter [Clostridium]|uniref:DMT family transporter n=2 Tax=Clostridium TaxID=1485 RepID=A0A0A7FYH5_9CLOT|nr:DMT family transporter [Clostridium baratii]AIY84648.1 hypothetical protein U729_1038 [Clostridium baratii str. Sullivan]AQM61271.1 hypothetical protein NPD11_1963 [Clostridium baratii]KJU71755.1 membrane protein [Clostridium baratii]MBS6007921.1 DMT family transporter [Clostridium baratii]MBS6042869.1 DMT family transporter [Clostridium baratii]
MLGIILSIISGVAMSLQGVFNTKLGDKIGVWETNTLVQLTGLILTLIITVFFGKGDFKELQHTSKIYLLGGVLGVIIIFTVMMGIGSLGPTYAISIILVSQLIAAAVIDCFGLFGCECVKFTLKEYIGVAIMIIGIIVFKWKR